MYRPVDNIVRLFSGDQPTRLHEIDIENLVGNGIPTKEQVMAFRNKYSSKINVAERDVVVVAAGPQNREAVIEGWPGAIYLFKKGEDGADKALIDFFKQIEDKSIFTDLFIASGDNIFAEVADEASLVGIETTVITGIGKKSWKLNRHRALNLIGEVENV